MPDYSQNPYYNPQVQSLLQKQTALNNAQQQLLAPQPTQVVSGYAVQQSPTQMLARALMAGLNGYQSSQVSQQLANLSPQQYQQLSQLQTGGAAIPNAGVNIPAAYNQPFDTLPDPNQFIASDGTDALSQMLSDG